MKRLAILLLLILSSLVTKAKEVESPLIVIPISRWTTSQQPVFNNNLFIQFFETKVVGYNASDNNWHDNFVITDINNKIWLEINPYDGIPIDFSFEVGVTLNVKYFSFPDGNVTEEQHTLNVNYDHNSHKEFKKIDLLHLKGGQRAIVTITEIRYPRVPGNINLANLYSKILLKAQTTDTRFYNKSVFQPIVCNTISAQNVGNSKVEITWPPTAYAEEYDVEYTFVDTYQNIPWQTNSNSDGHSPGFTTTTTSEVDYFNNATRITVKNNNLSLLLINEFSKYAFRIRAVGREGEGFNNRFEMPWSCNLEYINNAHNNDKLNYQTIATFAEEGKYKVVNEYFDGRMASRQKVTALQSNNYALVQESIYDGIGRKAIEVLPGAVMNGAVNFYPGFNRNLGGQPYGPQNFELIDSCRRVPEPMSTLHGTSRYYSPEFYNNLTSIQKQSELKLIPDAFGYPFTQTVFMNDNTNRPAAQGGVGRDHIINKGHDTKISYVNPTQAELDRLFGTEVGWARNYKKIVTKDPNGQVSFAYQDLKGNTIATSLWGKTDNLETLESYRPNTFTEDLAASADHAEDNSHIIIEHPFYVGEDNQNYVFNYEVATGAFRDATCNLSSICYDCVYDAHVTLVDNDCNTILFEEKKTIGPVSNIIQICEGANWRSALTTQILNEGKHTVKIVLTINEEVAQAYIRNYVNDPNNQCVEHLSDFQERYIAQIPDVPCDFDCDKVAAEISRLEALKRKGESILLTTVKEDEARRLRQQIASYTAQIKALNDMCNTDGTNKCKMAEKRMLADMAPFGQYGSLVLDTITNEWKGNGQLSIFSTSNILGEDLSSISYKSNQFTYPITQDGVTTNIDVNAISLSQFATTYWQDEWARQYLPYHPEYCYLELCDVQSADYDERLLSINTASAALAAGLITANGMGSGTAVNIINSDPIFGTNALLGSKKTEAVNEMNNYFINYPDNPAASSYYMVAKAQTCARMGDLSQACRDNISFASPPNMADQLWLSYRGIYLSLKQKYEYQATAKEAIQRGCYNGCIGADPFVDARDRFNEYDNISQICNSDKAGLYKDKQKVFSGPYDIPCMDGIIDIYDPKKFVEIANRLADCVEDSIINNNPSYGCGLSGEIPEVDINGYIGGSSNGSNNGCIPYDCLNSLNDFFLQLIDTLPNGRKEFMFKDYISIELPPCFRTSPFLQYNWKEKVFNPQTNTLTFKLGSAEADPNACDVSLKLVQVSGQDYAGLTIQGISRSIISVSNFQPDYTMIDASGETSYFTANAISNMPEILGLSGTVPIQIQGQISCAKFGRCCNDSTAQIIQACIDIRNVDNPSSINDELWIGASNPYFDPKWVENPCGDTSTIDIPEIICTDTISLCCPDTIITIPIPVDSCQKTRLELAMYNASVAYEQYITGIKRDLKAAYMAQCLAKVKQTFTMRYESGEHHFVLSYYDQSGNLTRTVPPNGTYDYYNTLPDKDKTFQTQAELDAVTAARTAGQRLAPIYEDWDTRYTYNSLNQITTQNLVDHGSATLFNQTPARDGISRFIYDELGRLKYSQNPQQIVDNKYSYTDYDAIGRIIEAGQFTLSGLPIIQGQILNTITLPTGGLVIQNMGNKEQITHTYYDEARLTIDNRFPNRKQENLRNRVAYAAYYDTWAERNDRNPVTASYYSYDEIGNVKALLQTMKGAFSKRMEYSYDLVSGNVNEVHYQPDEEDQFIHRYQYDADNSITEVQTSTDGCIWDKEARYFYYPHGPLARVEIGDEEVQGLDYVYTIHGWIKGVNSISLNPARDPMQDGRLPGMHSTFAPDELGYMLNYYGKQVGNSYQGDYHSISGSQTFEPTYNGKAEGLYNGNIRNMSTSIGHFIRMQPRDYGYISNDYRYDQLNRIKQMRPWDKYTSGTNGWQAPMDRTDSQWPSQPYFEQYAFDGNGNIFSLHRNGGKSKIEMDKMSYTYGQRNNRLTHVKDGVAASNYPVQPGKNAIYDIDNQNNNNYTYDRLGNMVSDASEGLTMEWNVSGKVRRIKDSNGLPHETAAKEINMVYDPLGNRVAKIVNNKATYYVRDAQGNVMATYQRSKSASTTVPVQIGLGNTINLEQWKETPVTWESAYIYGSDRLGEYRANKKLNQPRIGAINDTSFKDSGLSQIDLINAAINPAPTTTPSDPISSMLQGLNWGSLSGSTLQDIQDYMAELGNTFQQGKYKHNYTKTRHDLVRDQKLYELTNHLGNVLTTISDRKSLTNLTNGSFSNLVAEVASATDYYPGGMIMPERQYLYSDTTYRYKHQGQESDDEIAGTGGDYFYKYRMSDSRLVRFWSVDPLYGKYPYLSQYSFSENSPIAYIEFDGLEKYGVYVAVNYNFVKFTQDEPEPYFIDRKFDIPGYGEIGVKGEIELPNANAGLWVWYDTESKKIQYQIEVKGQLIGVNLQMTKDNVVVSKISFDPKVTVEGGSNKEITASANIFGIESIVGGESKLSYGTELSLNPLSYLNYNIKYESSFADLLIQNTPEYFKIGGENIETPNPQLTYNLIFFKGDIPEIDK